jgi:hypothetical protein
VGDLIAFERDGPFEGGVELENFGTSPVMLTEIESDRRRS